MLKNWCPLKNDKPQNFNINFTVMMINIYFSDYVIFYFIIILLFLIL